MTDGRATSNRVNIAGMVLVLLVIYLAGPILWAVDIAIWLGWLP